MYGIYVCRCFPECIHVYNTSVLPLEAKKKKGIGPPKSRVTHSGELPYMC